MKLLLRFLSTGACLITFQQSKSQSAINGIVMEVNDKPLQLVNVRLLNSTDSALVKETSTDRSGKYFFENVDNGKYLIKATFTGFSPAFTRIFEVASKKEVDAGILYLENRQTQLKDVIITAKKSLYEQLIDRMVINVKNSITNVGGTALDVLEKSPGITVNRQNNTLAINGKNGVTVMINGKMSYMPMDAVVQLLAATSADNIEKIELITSPPSKYDAEGNAGYINIVFINNPYEGLSGSYFLSLGYGKRASGAAGANFNYRSAKINLYGNYSFRQEHYLQPSSGFNEFISDGNLISNTSFSNRDAISSVQNARLGIDYQIGASTFIGALMGGYVNHWSMTANNGATVSTNSVPDTVIKTLNKERNYWNNIMTSINFQHTFKPGQVLYFDANYIYYKDNNPNTYTNSYDNNAMALLYREDLESRKITPINFRVFSSDYTTPIGKRITMETGAKVSLSRFTNDAGTSKLEQGQWIPLENLSAKYLLKENIGAAYTSINVKISDKLLAKAGLRYEYTTSNLGTAATADIVDRKYGELFPTLYLSQKFDGGNQFNLSYNRRITRPAFNDLAPFTVFFDPKTFFNGNPALQPAIANSIQASYNVKDYIFSLTYTREHNTIENFYFQTQKIDTVNNILYLSANNFQKEQYLIASLSLPFNLASWWSIQNNINLNWRQISTVLNHTLVQYQFFDYNLNSTQRLKFNNELAFELTGYYSSASYFGTTKFKPRYQLNAGLQKKFRNKKDILRLTANDILNTGGDYQLVDNLAIKGTAVKRNFNFGLLAYRITFTHNFGNTALKGERNRPTGAADELNRVHN